MRRAQVASRTLWLILLISGSVVMAGEDAADGAAASLAGAGGRGGGWAGGEVESGTPRYKLAACTLYRDEDRFLREWLEFHICNDFDHFFMYSDRQSSTCHKSILEPYVQAGIVTVHEASKGTNPQIPTFNQCVSEHGRDTAWIAFIDVDEFLFPAPSSPSSPSPLPLPQILDGYKQYAGVVVPWTLFGSSGHTEAQPGLVIENYVWRKKLPECNGGTCAFKVIAQGHAIEECDVHNHYFKEDYFAVNEKGIRMHDDASLLPTESEEGDFPSNVFRLHHYKTKSFQDAMIKLQRDGINGERSEAHNPRTRPGKLAYFRDADWNEVEDKSAHVYLECVKNGLSSRSMGDEARACEAKMPDGASDVGMLLSGEAGGVQGGGASTTLVTCLYDLGGMFDKESLPRGWKSWVANILSNIDTPTVVFTEPGRAEEIIALRPDTRRSTLKVIECPMQQFLSWKYREKFFAEMDGLEILECEMSLGMEDFSCVKAQVLGAQIATFLLQVARGNYFNTTHFLWVDPGTFRDGAKASKRWYRKWPSDDTISTLMESNRMVFGEGPPLVLRKGQENEEVLRGIGNAVFGGTASAIEAWHGHFYSVLDERFWDDERNDKIAMVLGQVCINEPAICHIVDAPTEDDMARDFLVDYLV